jgi:hypothetical protein
MKILGATPESRRRINRRYLSSVTPWQRTRSSGAGQLSSRLPKWDLGGVRGRNATTSCGPPGAGRLMPLWSGV